jgi:hypothetical protein
MISTTTSMAPSASIRIKRLRLSGGRGRLTGVYAVDVRFFAVFYGAPYGAVAAWRRRL